MESPDSAKRSQRACVESRSHQGLGVINMVVDRLGLAVRKQDVVGALPVAATNCAMLVTNLGWWWLRF